MISRPCPLKDVAFGFGDTFFRVRRQLDALVEFKPRLKSMQRSYISSDCLRWMLLGCLLGFAAFSGLVGSQRAWAQAAGLAPSGGLTVRSVAVGGAVSEPEIEVKTSGPVTPASQAVTGPDRIVIDFPGALPAKTLRALSVHHGSLRGIRTGLYQSQPPITRIVLDVDGPTDYQVTPVGNSIVIRLGKPAVASTQAVALVRQGNVAGTATLVPVATGAPMFVSGTTPATVTPNTTVTPAAPRLQVTVRGNLLSIHTEGATLSEVLYEVHRKTGADIAIPSGAERERVVVRLGPAPGKEVISSLLNGSRFNYILVGSDRDPGGFSNLMLSLKTGSGGSGMFAQAAPQPGGQFGQPPALATPPDPGMEQALAQQGGIDPSLAQAEPELDAIPDETPEPAADGAPKSGQPGVFQPQQLSVQPIGDGPQQ